ncbi:hypothetical protein ADK60_40425 [Streptomyces sp. XY431]|uniref:hypothetical protein n=1 Tax=Streptomyces sp. XY431 TaxID=1415562 RepID=UPI0006ADC801|nr:hypothetical protein [Streptomyces sp. XY431]KOV09634.1 hypothetical protein ADK60_40425 [Streptomyces sp. XY431]
MKPVPDTEVSGNVTQFTLELGSDGIAVLVAYAEDEDGKVSRSWLRFTENGTDNLRYAVEHLRLPRPFATTETERTPL